MQVVKILTAAFEGLTETQKQRLKHHLDAKTPICCGGTSDLFADGKGGDVGVRTEGPGDGVLLVFTQRVRRGSGQSVDEQQKWSDTRQERRRQ